MTIYRSQTGQHCLLALQAPRPATAEKSVIHVTQRGRSVAVLETSHGSSQLCLTQTKSRTPHCRNFQQNKNFKAFKKRKTARCPDGEKMEVGLELRWILLEENNAWIFYCNFKQELSKDSYNEANDTYMSTSSIPRGGLKKNYWYI